MSESTEQERPRIERLSGKIAMLERMQEYREQKLERGTHGANEHHFLREEIRALEAARRVMAWHRAEVEGLDNVVLALQGLSDAFEAFKTTAGLSTQVLDEALARAKAVLAEWGE